MPVTTPQPTSAADVSGTSSGMGTTCTSRTTVRSANTEAAAKLLTPLPSRVKFSLAFPSVWRHDVGRPLLHCSQKPQAARVAMIAWSPGFTCVTASPTSATIPAPSWPHTAGTGHGYRPDMNDRSLWHTPAATISTTTSRGPGARSSSPSTRVVDSPS